LKNFTAANKCSTSLPQPQLCFINRLIDRSARVLLGGCFALLVIGEIRLSLNLLHNAATLEAVGRLAFYAEISARMSFILFLCLMAALFFLRLEPLSKAKGILPRIIAIGGTFLFAAVGSLPRAELSIAATITATGFIFFGNIVSVYVLARLGRSFSIMAEARKLVITGPYTFVRHPLYLAEMVAVLGVVMQFFSVYAVLALFLHVILQVQRMKNEEAVLRDAFPEYADYQTATARFIPYLY
jgi:protein-S-isoprenylcysteine O-methyltransferase Ste14